MNNLPIAMMPASTSDTNSEIPVFANITDLYKAAAIPIEEIHPHFHIQKYEDVLMKVGDRMPPYRSDFYSIHIFTHISADTELVITNNTTDYRVTSCNVAFNSPGQLIQWRKKGNTLSGYAIHFKSDFINLLLHKSWISYEFPFFNFNMKRVLSFESYPKSRFINLCEEMLNEYVNKSKGQFQIIQAYLYILLIEINRLYEQGYGQDLPIETSNSRRAYTLVQDFYALIWKHIHEKHTVEEYAALLNVTASHLSETIKQVTGKRTSQLLNDAIIMEAKKLLMQTSLSVTQIGYELGFKDPSHFSKYFKNATSLTPLEFRQQLS